MFAIHLRQYKHQKRSEYVIDGWRSNTYAYALRLNHYY